GAGDEGDDAGHRENLPIMTAKFSHDAPAERALALRWRVVAKRTLRIVRLTEALDQPLPEDVRLTRLVAPAGAVEQRHGETQGVMLACAVLRELELTVVVVNQVPAGAGRLLVLVAQLAGEELGVDIHRLTTGRVQVKVASQQVRGL